MNIGTAFGRSLLMVTLAVLSFIQWLVIIWVILSWILFFTAQSSARWRYRKAFEILIMINEFFSRATSPLLAPFRRLLPPHKTAGIDWSPLLLLLVIYFLRMFLIMAFY